VKHQPLGRLTAVQPIADDRPVQSRRGMDTKLVRPSGLGSELDADAAGLAGERSPPGQGGAAPVVIHHLDGAVVDIQSHGQIDLALIPRKGVMARLERGMCSMAEQCDVRSARLASLELHGKIALGLGIECKDEQPGCLHVEAVDHERAGGPGKPGGNPRCRAVLLFRASAGDGEHPGWLLHDDVPGVLAHNPKITPWERVVEIRYPWLGPVF
jgi:hypothetical protein